MYRNFAGFILIVSLMSCSNLEITNNSDKNATFYLYNDLSEQQFNSEQFAKCSQYGANEQSTRDSYPESPVQSKRRHCILGNSVKNSHRRW